ncbi:hypothetical protein ACIPPS_28850 [Streptomyces sp. NPDC090127]|uniref:hypothetical protein n=1 Tax=Streptomyces sp. NPDC090127 TaxID=3365953 RepID=UPI00380C30F0
MRTRTPARRARRAEWTARAGPAGEHAHAEPKPDRHRVAESRPEFESEPAAHDDTDTRDHASAVARTVLGHAQP